MKRRKRKRTPKQISILSLLLALIMVLLCCPVSAASLDEPSFPTSTTEELPGGVPSTVYGDKFDDYSTRTHLRTCPECEYTVDMSKVFELYLD